MARFKSNGIQPRFEQVKDHVSGGQSRVATKLYLASACKPPQIIKGPSTHKKSGLRKIIFCSDLTQ